MRSVLKYIKNEWLLLTGVGLLTIGIVLKITIHEASWPLILIIAGILVKIFFVGSKINKSRYKPGFEIVLLVIGLSLFLLGVYLPANDSFIPAGYLKVSGISLKVAFVFWFMRKTSNRSNFDVDNQENKREEFK